MDKSPQIGAALAALFGAAAGRAPAKTYIAAGTKQGRQMTQAKGAVIAERPLSPHNQAVEEARRVKLQARRKMQEEFGRKASKRSLTIDFVMKPQ